jgi:hypothetical protein
MRDDVLWEPMDNGHQLAFLGRYRLVVLHDGRWHVWRRIGDVTKKSPYPGWAIVSMGKADSVEEAMSKAVGCCRSASARSGCSVDGKETP